MPRETMKVVLAYDGSPAAEAALNDLAWVGLPPDTDIKVLSIADVWPHSTPQVAEGAFTEGLPAAVKMARHQAAQAVDDAHHLAQRGRDEIRRRFPSWRVSAEAFADAPAWGIIKVAEDWSADLIILGTHGYSAIRRFVLGSVAQKVLTEARCSVRVARAHARPSGSPMRLIVGVDGSPGARAAVQAMAARHWPPGAEVRVMSVVDTDTSLATATFLPATTAWESQPAVQAAVDELGATGLTVTPLVVAGDPKDALLKEAETWQADTIFVGARGLRRLNYLVLGSVSTAVATHAACSVEVIRTRC